MTMKKLITRKQKHMLWHDELGSDFLLLKYAEVYLYSSDIVRLHVFSEKMLPQLRKRGLILDEKASDDDFHIIYSKVENLPQIIKLGEFRRRPPINGKWIKHKERVLPHKILKYRSKELDF